MSTDTKISVDQPNMTEAAPKPLRDTAVSDPITLAANDAKTVNAAPNRLDRANIELCSLTTTPRDDSAPNQDNSAVRSARQTLITAINKRITQQRLTAAQAAAVLHLTGPRVTQLLHANLDEFTLDELVNLLPALQLTIHVVPAPEQNLRSCG